jgi:hypothetical protein
MKVISISAFVALAALVHSSSALFCNCGIKFGQLHYGPNKDGSQKCCKDIMNGDIIKYGRGYNRCDVGSKEEEYKKCCQASANNGFGLCN